MPQARVTVLKPGRELSD